MSIFDDFPPSLNGMDGFNQWQKVVQSGNFRLYSGQIVNTKDHNALTNHYDVKLFDYDESGKRIPLYEVKVLSPTLGFDGANSVYHSYTENQPVLILARDGILDQAVIIGGFNTSGDHLQYLQAGRMDKPGRVYEDPQGQKEANQGSVYPYRVAKPFGYVRTVAGSNITSPHDDPKYYYKEGDDPEDNLTEKVAARPAIAGVELFNENGYTMHHVGPVSLYSFSQVILLSMNNRESTCSRLLRHASFYASMYEKLKAQAGSYTQSLKEQAKEEPKAFGFNDEALHGIIGKVSASDWLEKLILVPPTDIPEAPKESEFNAGMDYLEVLPTYYHLDQLAKLVSYYQQAAASCNQGQTAFRDASTCINTCEASPPIETISAIPDLATTPGQAVLGILNNTNNVNNSDNQPLPPSLRAFLDLISYDVPNNLQPSSYLDSSSIPNSKSLSKEDLEKGFPEKAGNTYKIGRYKLNRADWSKAKQGNPSIKAFTAEDQDSIAAFYLKQVGAISNIESGDIKGAISKASKFWSILTPKLKEDKAIAYYQERQKYYASLKKTEKAGPSTMPKSGTAPQTQCTPPSCAGTARDNTPTPSEKASIGTSTDRCNLELEEIISTLNKDKPDKDKVQSVKVEGGGKKWEAKAPTQSVSKTSQSEITVSGIKLKVSIQGGNSDLTLKAIQKALTEVTQHCGLFSDSSNAISDALIEAAKDCNLDASKLYSSLTLKPSAFVIKEYGGNTYSYKGEESLPVASAIKLVIADLVNKANLRGSLTVTEDILSEGDTALLGRTLSVNSLLDLMLRESNNTATNLLVKHLVNQPDSAPGVPNRHINTLISEAGYPNTKYNRYLSWAGADKEWNERPKNSSTASDLVSAMNKILDSKDESILAPLSKAPRAVGALPKGQVLYSKLGYTSSVASSVSVIEINNRRYIVSSIVSGVDGRTPSGKRYAAELITKVAEEVSKCSAP